MDTFSEMTPLGPVSISEENGRIRGLKFFASECTRCTDTLSEAFGQLNEYLNGKRKKFDLEYEPSGTEFQRSVWNGLLRIPYGQTVSYRDLAGIIGRPNAQRAVGNANGMNPIPIFIPCHRVIRTDGAIGGYSSGLEIKRRLLGIEGIIL